MFVLLLLLLSLALGFLGLLALTLFRLGLGDVFALLLAVRFGSPRSRAGPGHRLGVDIVTGDGWEGL